MNLSRYLSVLSLAALCLFLYAPMVLVVVSSFNTATYHSAWQGLSWRWYHDVLHNQALLMAAWHSLLLATLTSLLTTLTCSIMTFALCFYRLWGNKHWRAILWAMLIAPDLLLAIGFLIFAQLLHWPLGFGTLLVGHVALCLPLATLLNIQQFVNIPKNLFMAARDLGANDFDLYRHITLPLLKPSLLSVGLISFVISFDDTILSYFLTTPSYQTLPLVMFGMMKMGVTPTLHAASTLVLLSTIVVIMLATRRRRAFHVA